MAQDQPRAVVRNIDGQLVLDDPDALAMIRTVAKINCQSSLELNLERVAHFKNRATELGKSPSEVVIVVLNVDDINGGLLAEQLMPGHNWQEYRERGEIPFARGLAMRDGIQAAVEIIDNEAAEKLRKMTDLAVVVVDHGVAEVFPA